MSHSRQISDELTSSWPSSYFETAVRAQASREANSVCFIPFARRNSFILFTKTTALWKVYNNKIFISAHVPNRGKLWSTVLTNYHSGRILIIANRFGWSSKPRPEGPASSIRPPMRPPSSRAATEADRGEEWKSREVQTHSRSRSLSTCPGMQAFGSLVAGQHRTVAPAA